MIVICPFASDLLDVILVEFLDNPQEARVKTGRWEKFVFGEGTYGLVVLKGLLGSVVVPTRKLHGYDIFIRGVGEISYCREDGDVKLLCVLGQERQLETQ